jgi:hypothetical protein
MRLDPSIPESLAMPADAIAWWIRQRRCTHKAPMLLPLKLDGPNAHVRPIENYPHSPPPFGRQPKPKPPKIKKPRRVAKKRVPTGRPRGRPKGAKNKVQLPRVPRVRKRKEFTPTPEYSVEDEWDDESDTDVLENGEGKDEMIYDSIVLARPPLQSVPRKASPPALYEPLVPESPARSPTPLVITPATSEPPRLTRSAATIRAAAEPEERNRRKRRRGAEESAEQGEPDVPHVTRKRNESETVVRTPTTVISGRVLRSASGSHSTTKKPRRPISPTFLEAFSQDAPNITTLKRLRSQKSTPQTRSFPTALRVGSISITPPPTVLPRDHVSPTPSADLGFAPDFDDPAPISSSLIRERSFVRAPIRNWPTPPSARNPILSLPRRHQQSIQRWKDPSRNSRFSGPRVFTKLSMNVPTAGCGLLVLPVRLAEPAMEEGRDVVVDSLPVRNGAKEASPEL